MMPYAAQISGCSASIGRLEPSARAPGALTADALDVEAGIIVQGANVERGGVLAPGNFDHRPQASREVPARTLRYQNVDWRIANICDQVTGCEAKVDPAAGRKSECACGHRVRASQATHCCGVAGLFPHDRKGPRLLAERDRHG